jgi:hypothetical protein
MIATPGTLNHFWTHATLELHFVVTGLISHRSHVIELGSNFLSPRFSGTISVGSPNPGQGVVETACSNWQEMFGCRLWHRFSQFLHLPRQKYEYNPSCYRAIVTGINILICS